MGAVVRESFTPLYHINLFIHCTISTFSSTVPYQLPRVSFHSLYHINFLESLFTHCTISTCWSLFSLIVPYQLARELILFLSTESGEIIQSMESKANCTLCIVPECKKCSNERNKQVQKEKN